MMTNRTAISTFFFVNGLVFASWASRLPYLQEQFAINHRQIGWLLLIHSVGSILAMPMTGWLIGKYSSKKITTVTGLLFPILFLTIAFMPSYTLVFVPFFLMGISTGMVDVAMNAQAVAVEEDLQKPVMTMFHAVFSIGMVAGGIIGGLFISSGLSLWIHFLAIASLSILVLLVAAQYLLVDKPSAEEGSVHFLLPRGPALLLGLIAFCCMMGEGAISDWSTNYMKRIIEAADHLQAYGLTAFAGCMTFGRLFGDRGRLAFGDKKMLIYGAIISIIGGVTVVSASESWIAILGFGLVGLGLSNIVPIIYSLAGKLKGISPGAGIAMATTIGYSGFMIGPPVIGFISDATSLRYGLGLLAVLFVIMFLLILISVNRILTNETT